MMHLRTLTRAVRVASPALSAAAARPSLLTSRCCPALLRLSTSRPLSTQPPSDPSSSPVPPPTAASRPRKIPRAASVSSAASGPAAAAGAAASGASDAAADPSLTRSVPRVTETTDQEAGLDTPVPKGKEWKPSQATPELPLDKEALAEAPAQGQAQAQAAAGVATPAQTQPAAETATPASPESHSTSTGGAGVVGDGPPTDGGANAESKPLGLFSWQSMTYLALVGGGLLAWYLYEQDLQNTVQVETSGTPLVGIGGDFALTDDQGKTVSSESLRGKYVLLYFGFTHCPDICPTELHKMEHALKLFAGLHPTHTVVPIFISLDPRRDTPARLREYKKAYDPSLLWLTGTPDELERLGKSYRVYSNASEAAADAPDDYLIDHSIYFYLLDRQGKFMEVFGKTMAAEEVAGKMARIVAEDNKHTEQSNNRRQRE